jgi:hypothetical protein
MPLYYLKIPEFSNTFYGGFHEKPFLWILAFVLPPCTADEKQGT